MEKVKYISGDLVMTNGTPIGTKNGQVYVVTASDPNKTLTLKDGTVNKGVVTLDAVTEKDKDCFVETSTWVKHIVPIGLTIDILKKNGWKKTKHIVDYHGYEYYKYENENCMLPEVEFYPKTDYRSEENFSAFYGDTEIRPDIHYLHELQNLIFGLDIEFEFKL
mgnify:FL=1